LIQKKHISTIGFDKYSTRPPITREDSPNPNRFEPFNIDPPIYTKVNYPGKILFDKNLGRKKDLFEKKEF